MLTSPAGIPAWQKPTASLSPPSLPSPSPSLTSTPRWPVIIGIIVASLVIISLLWCCVRCLCCGLSCCCDCFSCCGIGGGRNRNRGDKYADPPQNFQPAPYQGYQPPPAQGYQQPPNQGYGPGPINQGYNPTRQQPVYEPPQFAQFDVSKKPVNDDALPPMPSWENATSQKVLEEHDGDMEMGTLEPAQTQRLPMLTTQAPSPPAGYAEAPSHPLDSPYQQHTAYNGADLGSPHTYGAPTQPQWTTTAQSQPQYGQRQQAYTDQPPPPTYSQPARGTHPRQRTSSKRWARCIIRGRRRCGRVGMRQGFCRRGGSRCRIRGAMCRFDFVVDFGVCGADFAKVFLYLGYCFVLGSCDTLPIVPKPYLSIYMPELPPSITHPPPSTTKQPSPQIPLS